MDITKYIVRKRYYGNAQPEGKTVLMGGKAVVVGGWAEYEADRRQALWKANPRDKLAEPRTRYGGRTYVTGQDALESLLAARRGGGPESGGGDLLERSANRLEKAFQGFRKKIFTKTETVWGLLGVSVDAPVTVTNLSAEDIRRAVSETDPIALHHVAETVGRFAAGYAREDELPQLRPPRPPKTLPAMSSREIPMEKGAEINDAIVELEKETVPRASVVEEYRGAVASVFDTAASVLKRV